MLNLTLSISLLLILLSSLAACGGGGGGAPPRPKQQVNIQVNWNANREVAVNTTGGGYRVYYATTTGLALTDPGVTMAADLPYVSGTAVPLSTTLSVESGHDYYFSVTAYSARNRIGQTGGTESQPAIFKLNVP